MATCRLVCVVVFVLVAAVFSQSHPRFEFNGTVLTNNSYIRRHLIGIGPNNSLHCVTDNSDCCNNGEGNWYNYTGSVVQQGTNGDSELYVTRGTGVIYLNRITGGSSGMWRCDIPDSTGTLQSIYIYLGTIAQGRLTSSVISFTLESEPNEEPPEFTLTCHSEGGPATTVEWRRNGELVQEDSNHMTSQIIVDPSRNAVYSNTLRVRGREDGPGTYTCNVSNNFQDFNTKTPPSVNISTFLLFPSSTPTQFNATYKSLTNIVLEWTYDIPISTGYTYVVYYQQAQSEGGGHFNVSFNINKNADNMYKYSLTDIPDGNVYSISIVATRALSPSLPSPVVGPITPTVEAPSVSLLVDGSRVSGNAYTLTCTVTLPEDIQPDYPPTIQWQTPQSASYTEAISTISGCSCISTITLNSLQETDEGDYVCTASYGVGVFQSPTIMAITSVIVLPPLSDPIVSVRAEGSAVAGSNDYTLVCDITIPSVSDDTPTVTVQWTLPSGHNYASVLTAGDYKYYSRLLLTPLTHDKEGDYTCDAVYMVDGATSSIASNTYHVAIGVGHNDVSVEVEGSGSGVVGSLYTLTCTVTLSDRPASGSSVSIQWQGPTGLSHSDDDDTTDNRVVVSQLALDPLTLAHGGDYTCTAEYTVNGQTITESEEEELFIIIPDPSVMVTASDEVILVGKDIEIYCDIDLIGVTLGRDIGVDVTWFRGNVILTNHTRVTISGLSGDSTDVHSTLTLLSVLLSDMATYGCHVTLTPLLGSASPVTASDFLLLVVNEPVNPVRPGQVMVRNIKADSAIILWTVVYISYSPETYIVQYGTCGESLNQNSSSVYSGDDITITRKTYSVVLSGLSANTTYYVQVLATNTAQRSNTSVIERLTTLPLMEMAAVISSDGDNTAAVVGGVLSLVIILISGVSALVTILLIFKIRSLTSTLHVGGEVEDDHKTVPTATNMAYGMVSHDQQPSGEEVMYELMNQSQQPSSSQSARPTAATDEPAYAVIPEQ